MKDKIAKVIRTATIAPIMALGLLIVMYIFRPMTFINPFYFILSIVCLVLLPISAYPLQQFIPCFKKDGRNGQRNLAIIMANVGYILGVIVAYLSASAVEMLIIYLTYFFSGALILIINKSTRVKASGHACGVAGPIVTLTYFLGLPALGGIVVLLGTYWASLTMNRHTKSEFLIGSLTPVAALFITVICTNIV